MRDGTGQTTKRKKISIINIVLEPSSIQTSERYIELFQSLYGQKTTVNVRGDKWIRIKSLFVHNPRIIYGDFVSFIRLNSELPSLNTVDNSLVQYIYNEDIGPNAKTKQFFFIPEAHRLVIFDDNIISINLIAKYLEDASKKILQEDEDVAVTIEKSEDAISRIVGSSWAKSIRIRISYSNNDNNDSWDKLIDQEYRNSDSRIVETKYEGTRRSLINIQASELIKAQVRLSRSNGFTDALILENEKLVRVNTISHQRREIVEFQDDPKESILQKIMSAFRDHL